MKTPFLFCLALLAMALPATGLASGHPVDYTVNGEPYEGFFVSPAADAPLVLLVHDWDGLTDYEIKRARMLADLGYAVFAADLFGKGIRPAAVPDKRRLTGALYKDRGRMRELLQAALQTAENRGADTRNALAMGYCFGGTAVLELARSGADLKGFVSFHGGLATPEGQDYAQTQAPVLVLHGSADTHVSMAQFAQLARELEAFGIAHEMITYGGAPHAFTVFDTDRYRKDADSKSWRRFTRFLEHTLR